MLMLLLPMFLLVVSKLYAQISIPGIDVLHYTFDIQLNDSNDTIKGKTTVAIRFTKDIKAFQLNLVNRKSSGKGMLVSAISESGRRLSFTQDSDVVSISTNAKAGSVLSFVIEYSGIPADGLIISINKYGHRTFFGDNWPNRAHNWLPCADYPGDKATVDFIVTAPDHYQVVANGLKVEESQLSNHFKLTRWHETAPLPTKVMVIGVADFAIDHPGDPDHIPVYTYVFPENETAGFKNYAFADEILPFYIKKIGPYAYEKLANVQSKTIFGGMENAGAIFYFENSVTSAGIEELMAHEIAHQWFGDAASEKNFSNLWLSEGFATYMTNVYLEDKYGVYTLKKRLIADRATVVKFETKRNTPVVDTAVKGNYMQLLNANSYQKGSWVLHMLRRKLGEDMFWKGIRAYYKKYDGGNANTDDLRQVMEQVSGQNLKLFFKQWLFTSGHPKLNISWKYNNAKHEIYIAIIQEQNALFECPLTVSVNGSKYKINLRDKETRVHYVIKQKPAGVVADPDVDLLASFEIKEIK